LSNMDNHHEGAAIEIISPTEATSLRAETDMHLTSVQITEISTVVGRFLSLMQNLAIESASEFAKDLVAECTKLHLNVEKVCKFLHTKASANLEREIRNKIADMDTEYRAVKVEVKKVEEQQKQDALNEQKKQHQQELVQAVKQCQEAEAKLKELQLAKEKIEKGLEDLQSASAGNGAQDEQAEQDKQAKRLEQAEEAKRLKQAEEAKRLKQAEEAKRLEQAEEAKKAEEAKHAKKAKQGRISSHGVPTPTSHMQQPPPLVGKEQPPPPPPTGTPPPLMHTTSVRKEQPPPPPDTKKDLQRLVENMKECEAALSHDSTTNRNMQILATCNLTDSTSMKKFEGTKSNPYKEICSELENLTRTLCTTWKSHSNAMITAEQDGSYMIRNFQVDSNQVFMRDLGAADKTTAIEFAKKFHEICTQIMLHFEGMQPPGQLVSTSLLIGKIGIADNPTKEEVADGTNTLKTNGVECDSHYSLYGRSGIGGLWCSVVHFAGMLGEPKFLKYFNEKYPGFSQKVLYDEDVMIKFRALKQIDPRYWLFTRQSAKPTALGGGRGWWMYLEDKAGFRVPVVKPDRLKRKGEELSKGEGPSKGERRSNADGKRPRKD